jgi:hypothetical protein
MIGNGSWRPTTGWSRKSVARVKNAPSS